MRAAGRARRGMTLVEVLLASALLVIAIVPLFGVLTGGLEMAQEVERRTTATLLAQKEIETAVALAEEDDAADLAKTNADLGGGYLAHVEENDSGIVTKIGVVVGWDADGSGTLSDSEVLVGFATMAAYRGDPNATGGGEDEDEDEDEEEDGD